ncbi:MAG: copper chaperone PCu(A)C [Defluviicoccus sp.]|nr:copper chaperone PCu(A)C [Defluviicoccus sp.]
MHVLTAVGLFVLLPVSFSKAQQDGAHRLGPLTVEAPWARASAGAARAGAAYLRIVNAGAETDRLLRASSPVAERVELHTHRMRDGVMRMRRIEAVSVPGNEAAELKPGGDHVMLMGLTGPLKQGTAFPLTLSFEKAGKITVPVAVRPITARGPAANRPSIRR